MMPTRATNRRKPFGEVEPYKVKARKPKPTAVGHNPKLQGEFEATLKAERREAEAKAETAERKRDEAPLTRGPKVEPKIGSKSLKLPRILGVFKRQVMRAPRKVLLAEMVAALVIITVARVSEGEAPKPSDYLAPFVVYLVLSFAAEFGGSASKFASAFGALILLSILVSHSPGIVRGLQVVTFGSGQGPATYVDYQGNVIDTSTGGIAGGVYGPPTAA